jgi:D-arabinose 1-dehydrogenase-like Zn-dependent alcohol dehydrogenase
MENRVKAAVVEGPNRLVVKNIPDPTPGDYQALCELLYGATCSGTDSHIVEGTFPWISPYPTVPGHESVGRVVELGPKVRYLKKGDLIARVGTPAVPGYSVTWGGFAELGIATDFRAAQEDGLPQSVWGGCRTQRPLPPGIDPASATMFITWRETLSYSNRIGISSPVVGGTSLSRESRGTEAPPTKSVLVIGSGGNALAYIAHAANAGPGPSEAEGCPLRVMIGSTVREAAARKAGATHFLDYKAAGVKEAAARLCPDGFDIAIDAVGKAGLANLALALLKRGGTIGIYGIDDYGRVTLNPDAARGSFAVYRDYLDEAETHDQVIALYQSGKLDPTIWLDLANPFELYRIADAFDAIRSRKAVKALVRLRG